jgi:membrane protein YdbS with pleckstrin-like domain
LLIAKQPSRNTPPLRTSRTRKAQAQPALAKAKPQSAMLEHIAALLALCRSVHVVAFFHFGHGDALLQELAAGAVITFVGLIVGGVFHIVDCFEEIRPMELV